MCCHCCCSSSAWEWKGDGDLYMGLGLGLVMTLALLGRLCPVVAAFSLLPVPLVFLFCVVLTS